MLWSRQICTQVVAGFGIFRMKTLTFPTYALRFYLELYMYLLALDVV